MCRAILADGPQGAGKTTFCREIARQRPDVLLIERDAIVIELYGPRAFDPYACSIDVACRVMWEKVRHAMESCDANTVLVDAFHGSPTKRTRAGHKLRSHGATQVDLWYFTTHENTCVQQYMEREGERWRMKPALFDMNAGCCRRNYRTFHRMPIEIPDEESAFDSITFINPHQLTFIPYSELLLP